MNFWMNNISKMGLPESTAGMDAKRMQTSNQSDLKSLQSQVERLGLLNQALWELLQERLDITNADLEAKAQEIDLRDGKPDGKISEVAVRCPTCQRVCNSKHDKCLYCGTLFEKPLFG